MNMDVELAVVDAELSRRFREDTDRVVKVTGEVHRLLLQRKARLGVRTLSEVVRGLIEEVER